jgi:hypothetical protein
MGTLKQHPVQGARAKADRVTLVTGAAGGFGLTSRLGGRILSVCGGFRKEDCSFLKKRTKRLL